MRALLFLLLVSVLPGEAAARREALGIFQLWGAFREENRCYAISEPYRSPRPDAWRPFAAVGFWPRHGVRSQIHFRLSRAKRRGSAVLLRIDDRTFQLIGGGNNAWAPDGRADAAILAAMRAGIEMTLETRSERGTLVRDSYRLRGAATAIDSAAIACARPAR